MISEKIISLEKKALARWYKGDPDGYLELYANDIVYFDPETERRIDGHDAVRKYYEPIRGLISVDRDDMINPKVQASKDMAVLTFNLITWSGDRVFKWNCTEVYRLESNSEWKIIQSHWSYIKPELK